MNQIILKGIRDSDFSLGWLARNCSGLSRLKNIPQNPEYHGEGDVYQHTEMVCGKLVELPEWRELEKEEQELLFLAAAFHDIGKAVCTKQEDGQWVSPKHTIIGEKEFRRIAYKEAEQFGLTFRQRETAAKLIRYHGLPVWFWTKRRPELDLLKAAESIPLRLLYLLSKADVQGRIEKQSGKMEENVELFADYARESGVWEKPFLFANPYTKYQYFHKEGLWQEAELYDDTEFDVILMSGLPLAGKDSWIGKNGKEMPVISLDEIREKMGISPTKGSGKVVQAALEEAKNLLRRKEPFIWNATNIIQETRQKLVGLFAGYGARVHIMYLEAPYRELLARNRKRERYIPELVLEDMIKKMELPAPWEAYDVKGSIME
ncbi:MAG: AAA family ATPase [Lachnospiraceae bacterium]|nr:AAA family ATPase [Lachnospiraceae bacterium]